MKKAKKLAKPSILNDLSSLRRVRDRALVDKQEGRHPEMNAEIVRSLTTAIGLIEKMVFGADVPEPRRAG